MSKRGKARKETLADADAAGKVSGIEAFVDYIKKGRDTGKITDHQAKGILSALNHFIGKDYPCLLCGKNEPKFFGVFIPTESIGKLLGQPEGKSRIVFYGICRVCAEIPDLANLIENQIVTSLSTP